ncbi:LptF/LptG family permease [Candidatus Cardinium hertigii]|jgi:lipopolysaccharide export system permease protein|nr:LptF/LptG family permease [Candidatus Cardinium hertigii]
MKLLDKYIFKKFFGTFLVMLGVIIILIMLIHVTENVSNFKKYKVPFKEIFHYYCVLLPYMVNLLAPIIVFATTIWVTTRLAQRSEIIALLSGGVRFNRVAKPYLMIAWMLTGANFYLTGWLLAGASKERIKFETKYLNMGFTNNTPPPYLHLKTGPDQYLHIHTYYAHINTGYDISLDSYKNTELLERLHAAVITWNATDQVWILQSWKKRTFFPKHEEITEGHSLTLPLEIHPEDFEINPNLKEGLTLPELDIHIQKLMAKGNDNVRFFKAEKYIRYMTPFAIIILIALGFLVAVHKPRSGVGGQITLGFILACFYISLFLSSKIVVEAQSAHPLLNIWMPNIIFSILCIIFYRLVPK